MMKFLTLFFCACILCSCDKEKLLVAQINFDSESITLPIGSRVTLNVSHSPSDLTAPTYFWTSSDSSIVNVTQSGVIYALELGCAEISAITDAGLTAACVVTVAPIEATEIILSNNELSLDIGMTYELAYQILPYNTTDKTVVWSSSNNSVATVKDGGITAISEGVINIKIELSNKVSDVCELTVCNVDVDSISLSISELTIEETETFQLFATIAPLNATNKDFTWASSDTSVATIDEMGNIVGLKAGSTTITATTADGGHSVSCELTVTEIKVKSIALEWKSIKLAKGETYTLVPTISPYNAANQNISWSSSSSSVVTVDTNGGLTALSQGGATIYAKSEDCDFYTFCYVEVKPIDEYLVLDATLGSLSMNTTTVFQLNDRLYNPTSLPITINSYFFIKDSPFEFATGYPCGDVITKGEYKYNLFEDNVYVSPTTGVSWSDFATEVARYSIRYYITCNGVSYTLEQSYNGNSNSNLNKAPTISDWWE